MYKPINTEYPEYFENYIRLVPDGDILELLKSNGKEFSSFLRGLSHQQLAYRYAEGKWNIVEMLMHITDVERVMAYRALVAARNDENTIVYSMDDALYIKNSNVENLSFDQVLTAFDSVRNASLVFFSQISEEQSHGVANGNKGKFSARALAYIILGHCMHHRRIIEERYLSISPIG